MSELNSESQICHFCATSKKLAYYCENCGASCCSDCLATEKIESYHCQACNSKNIKVSEDENKKVCLDCGDQENVIMVTQHIKSCPKCNSHNITNIFEKKEKLEQSYLDLIKSTREFLKPFREKINYLSLIKEKIKKAREAPIKCYHFPKMESNLLSIFKLLKYIEENLLEKINIHFHHLALNREYFLDIYSQPNSNVRIIEGILENLRRSYETIEEFIDTNIETIGKDIQSIENNLKFIDKITKYFTQYKRYINLADEEKPVYAINAKLTNGLNNQDIFKRTRGVLFITNLDLSFVHEYGLIKKKQELIFKAPVDDLIRLKEKGKLFKKLYIEFSYGKYEFSLSSQAIERIIEYILLARNFDETTIFDHESAGKLETTKVDLTNLKNFIEDGINSFFSYKVKVNNSKKNHRKESSNRFFSNEDQYLEKQNAQNRYYPPGKPYTNQMNPSYGNYHPERSPDLDYPTYRSQYGYNYRESEGYNPQYPYNQNNVPPYRDREFRREDHLREHSHHYHTNPIYPDRFQNYHPKEYRNDFQNAFLSQEEKNLLMKKLEHFQKFAGNNSPQYNNLLNELINAKTLKKTSENYNSPENLSNIQDYTRNHLSNAFNSNTFIPDLEKYKNTEDSGFETNLDNKILELKKERYSIQETLVNLDKKFDQGKISEVDYLRAFKNLKKEVYIINKKLQKLKTQQQEHDSIRNIGRKYENRRYFT